jgi:hypothetical protein
MIAAAGLGLSLARGLPDYLMMTDEVVVYTQLSKTSPSWNANSSSGMGWFTTWGKGFTTAGRPLRERPSYWLGHVPCWSAPCLLSLTLAAMALGFRGPRPSFRRMVRRPGMAAGLAVILAVVVMAIEVLRFCAVGRTASLVARDSGPLHAVRVLTSFVPLAGFSVAVWWLGLALSGRWSAEVNAGGRLGRVIGWCWIAMAVSGEIGAWCLPLNY